MSGKKSCLKAQTRLEEYQKRLKKERANQEKSPGRREAKKDIKSTKPKIDEHRMRLTNSQTDSIVKGLLKPSNVFQRKSSKKPPEKSERNGRNVQEKASCSSSKVKNLQNVSSLDDNLLEIKPKKINNSQKLNGFLRPSKECSNKTRSQRNDKSGISEQFENAQKYSSKCIIGQNVHKNGPMVDKALKNSFKRPYSQFVEYNTTMGFESTVDEIEIKRAKTYFSNQNKINLNQSSSKLVPNGEKKKEKKEILTETGKANLFKRRKPTDQHKIVMTIETENQLTPQSRCSKYISPLRQEENPLDLSMDFEINKDHLQNVRNLVDSSEIEEMDWENSVLNPLQSVPTKPSVLYVVDTNVFLSSLSLIQKIKSTVIRGLNPLVVVPWQVLKELDYLKKDSSPISRNARSAISHLLKWLSASDSSITGQTAQNANADFPGFKVEVADDHLIKCCLQLKINNPYVILLTNDKNLGVKSLVNQVPTLSDEQLTSLLNDITLHKEKLHLFEKLPKNNDVQMLKIYKLTSIFKDCASQIIEKCLRQKYGDIWVLYAPGDTPWCIRLIIRTLRNISQYFLPEISVKIIEFVTKIENILMKYEKDSKITVKEEEKIGKVFYYLIKTMGFIFKTEFENYEKQSAFYKSRDFEDIESSYSLECCKLTMTHFNLFHEKVYSFCCWISNKFGIPLNMPSQIMSNFQHKLDNITHHYKNINLLMRGLERVYQVPIENINIDTDGLQDIYNVLVSYSDNAYQDFSCEDVLEFSINPLYRQHVPHGIEKLYKFYEYLSSINKNCA